MMGSSWLIAAGGQLGATNVASRPFTNHPVCAAKERDLLIDGAATPPLKGGEWTRLVTKFHSLAPALQHLQLISLHVSSDNCCSPARASAPVFVPNSARLS